MTRKITILFILISLLVTFVACSADQGVNTENSNNNDNDQVLEVVVSKPEIKIKTISGSASIEISEEEMAFIENEAIIRLDYLSNVDRLIFDWDREKNKLAFVYEDQTMMVNLTSMEVLINNQEVIENKLIINRGQTLYVSLEELSKHFNITSDVMTDPVYLLTLDFNSNGQASYAIKDQIDQINADLPSKINMTWEAVYSAKTNVSKLYDMPGLDIISPVWYEVTEGSGVLKSKKQDDYIEWAASKGYTLWPAVTNSFDPEMTHELITDVDNRTTLINKLVEIYANNEFPGINIDFENIYKDDKAHLSQFIAELTAAFHRQGMLVSIDVTFAGGSDNWSKCYDRKVLGEWVDFVVIMSYDEHWGSSPISGSVASMNWLDKNLNLLVQEVDADKVIMGIPFYMRIWFERPHKEVVNNMKVTSDAITMHKMESILASGDYNVLWDENAGQNYISFIDEKDNAVKKIWIEDAESLKLKLTMVHKYNLKGIASWRRGYELESIWPVLEEALNR